MEDIEPKNTFDRKSYIKNYMKQYNNQPKITCDICHKTFKPCSVKAHKNTKFHIAMDKQRLQTL